MTTALLPFLPHFGLHYLFHYGIVLAYAFLMFDYRRLNKERISFLAAFFFLILIFLILDVVIDNANLYELREYLKIIFLIVFFFLKPVNVNKFVNRLFFFTSCYLFLVLCGYLVPFDFQLLSSYYYFPGMESLNGVQYSRHVGILGNPNHTALFYVVLLLIFIGSKERIDTPRIMYFVVLVLLASFAFLTLSRSVLFSFVFVFLIYKFSVRRFVAVVLFLFVLLLFSDVPSLIERFSSLSSLYARFSNWAVILQDFSYKQFFFGMPISELNMAFDSEYLLFFVRHGIFVFLLFVAMNIYFIVVATKKRLTSVAMIHSVLLACALSMATYSDPRILLLTLVYTFGMLNDGSLSVRSLN